MGDWNGAPQQLLASVTEGVQRFTKQLQPRRLEFKSPQATQTNASKRPVPHRAPVVDFKSHQVVVDGEGVLTPLQVRNNVHRAAIMLGAAVLGKLGRLGNKLKEHHLRLKEEGEAQRAVRKARREEDNPLRLSLPWQRKRRRGPDNEGGIFRMGGHRAAAHALIQRGKEHERQMDVRAAVRSYEEANALVPDATDTLCLAAKAWSDLCYLDEIEGPCREPLSTADKQAVNRRAMQYAQQAISLSPDKALPHVACCISMGRLAVFSDNKTKVKLVKDAREQAVIALQKEPRNDLAQHLMGRWHTEMANLNSIVRTLIKLMYGADLPPGTHAEALQHYRAACALDPARLVHRVELGRTLWRLGDKRSALAELESAMDLDVEDINAHLQKVDAEILVKDLRRSLRRRAPAQQQAQPPAAKHAAGDATQGDTGIAVKTSVLLLAGSKPFWGWRPPQLRNPFIPQVHPDSPADQQPVAAQDGHPGTGAQQGQPQGGAHIGAPAFLGWRWGTPVEPADAAAPGRAPPVPAKAAASSRASQQRGLGLPHLPNPFEGWGRRVSPA